MPSYNIHILLTKKHQTGSHVHMTMKKMKRTTKIVLLMMFSICLQHLHASTSNPKKTIHFVGMLSFPFL
ncbi:hypothetical protein Hdeb2414_s0009g00302221 [Helianthus debilis subsp. tardiflorus]